MKPLKFLKVAGVAFLLALVLAPAFVGSPQRSFQVEAAPVAAPVVADLSNPLVNPFAALSVATNAITYVDIPDSDVTITHLNRLADFTASTSTDYCVIMTMYSDSDSTVTMANNSNDGIKVLLVAGGSITLPGSVIPKHGSKRTIQIEAVGHSAKIQVISSPARP